LQAYHVCVEPLELRGDGVERVAELDVPRDHAERAAARCR
jgi:hypothetical protein